MSSPTHKLKWRSAALTDGASRAPARAMLRATGLTDADLERPLVGVANTWIEIGPCNYHLRELAAHVKDGMREAGGTPMEFNTVSISDGITMGSRGHARLARQPRSDRRLDRARRARQPVRRARRAGRLRQDDSRPAVWRWRGWTFPGSCSTAARLRRAACRAATSRSRTSSRPSARTRRARMSDAELDALEHQACPGAGACGGQFTANTMATVCEFLGISPFGSASVPATDPRQDGGRRAAPASWSMDLLRRGLRPRQIITQASARERDRGGRRHRRLDQRRAAPAGDRQGSRRAARASTTSIASARACRCSPTSSRAAASSPRTSTRPAACRWSRKRLHRRRASPRRAR